MATSPQEDFPVEDLRGTSTLNLETGRHVFTRHNAAGEVHDVWIKSGRGADWVRLSNGLPTT